MRAKNIAKSITWRRFEASGDSRAKPTTNIRVALRMGFLARPTSGKVDQLGYATSTLPGGFRGNATIATGHHPSLGDIEAMSKALTGVAPMLVTFDLWMVAFLS
jgi:hypothetical protein